MLKAGLSKPWSAGHVRPDPFIYLDRDLFYINNSIWPADCINMQFLLEHQLQEVL